MADKQRKWGQYFTTPDLVDLVLGFCLRRPEDRLLDPSCGQGVFLQRAAQYQRWLAISGRPLPGTSLWGVEIDPEAAAEAGRTLEALNAPHRIVVKDFFQLGPGGPEGVPAGVDCVVGNPPYTRAEWLAAPDENHSFRDSLVLREDEDGRPGGAIRLSKRSGLYAYFFVHGYNFLRPGGRLGYVVSNSWLDVAYGVGLKRFLLDHFKLVAIIESDVERWFDDAHVNACVVILEQCDDPAGRSRNQVRFARLRRPLSELMTRPSDSAGRAVEVEGLVMRLMPGQSRVTGDTTVQVVPQDALRPEEKWGPFLKAPAIYWPARRHSQSVALGEAARVWRGQTSGANGFFYLTPTQAARWNLEARYLRPVLKSPKGLGQLRIEPETLDLQLLQVTGSRDALAGSQVARYIEWGEEQNYHRRATCARRPLWYALAPQPAVEERLVWPKGIWARHFCALAPGVVAIDQQFYGVDPMETPARVLAALLNSSWVALQAELNGRSNFGKGVLWLARYELERFRIPDPRRLTASQQAALTEAWEAVARLPLLPAGELVQRPEQQALDALVGDLMGLTPAEQRSIRESLAELVETRIRRATGV